MCHMTVDAERQALLLRGTLDMCLLSLLLERPSHAYDLAARLAERGLPGVGYGTLYPLVTRLRRQGLLDERSEDSPHGPARKVFRLSQDGRRALAAWSTQWLATSDAISSLLRETSAVPPDVQEFR